MEGGEGRHRAEQERRIKGNPRCLLDSGLSFNTGGNPAKAGHSGNGKTWKEGEGRCRNQNDRCEGHGRGEPSRDLHLVASKNPRPKAVGPRLSETAGGRLVRGRMFDNTELCGWSATNELLKRGLMEVNVGSFGTCFSRLNRCYSL